MDKTYRCAEGQSCTLDKFRLASLLRTGVIYICDFHFVSLQMPESLTLLGTLKRKRNQSLRFSAVREQNVHNPLSAGSIPIWASSVVMYVTCVHCAGKRVRSQLAASLLSSLFPFWQWVGVLCQPGLEEQPAFCCTECSCGEHLKS